MELDMVKSLFAKMLDYKRYGIVLLAVGAFFYLGVIIPSVAKSDFDMNIMMGASLIFLTFSVLFLNQSKICRRRLLESEEGQEYMMKK